METSNQPLLNERAAAAFLGFTVSALRNWRWRGGGTRFLKISAKAIRYQASDLQAWIDERLRTSTSDDGAGAAAEGSSR
ncbi:MAG: DNA-binding protein [Candidatus Omnitrophota bacterium]